ncbi:MAG: phosphatase PAP2 family protein [Bacteroidota bacterium]
MKKLVCLLVFTFCIAEVTSAQRSDSLFQAYNVNDTTYYYPRPKQFAFVTKLPATYAGAARIAFRKESLKTWGIIAGSTAVLLLVDQDIANKLHQFSNYIGLDNTRRYGKSLAFNIGGTRVDVYDVPKNLNSGIYSLGEGIPPLVIGAGLWGFGLIKNDYRARSTASQIVQATVATGFMTQFLKRTSGRESPFRATQAGGKWRPFPKPSIYQKNVSMYDAFPSGHMGTMVSTYVVITENYPEKKWIHPVGLSIISLVGLAMINNDVHWASDYPLAMGMGYAFGKATVKLNRFIKGEPMSNKKKKRR